MTKIESIEQLRELASRPDGLHCFVQLNYGCRSSKFIKTVDGCPKGNEFYIFNLIDDSEFYVMANELTNPKRSIIGEAMKAGALIAEDEK